MCVWHQIEYKNKNVTGFKMILRISCFICLASLFKGNRGILREDHGTSEQQIHMKFLGSFTPRVRNAKRESTSKTEPTSYYYSSQNSAAWATAVEDCKLYLGAESELLAIDSRIELESVTKFLGSSDDTGSQYWTAGYYDQQLKTFVFKAGHPLPDWIPFDTGYPDTHSPATRVLVHATDVRTSSGLKFRTQLQTASNRYICELTETIKKEVNCSIPTDLLILLDSSKNVASNDFQKLKEFISRLAAAWITEEENRISVINYADSADTLFPLSTPDHDQLIEMIMRAEFIGGESETSAGLYKAVEEITKNGRQTSPKIVILLAAGVPKNLKESRAAADKVKKMGANLFVIGIGMKVIKSDVLLMASAKTEAVFKVENVGNLRDIEKSVEERICS